MYYNNLSELHAKTNNFEEARKCLAYIEKINFKKKCEQQFKYIVNHNAAVIKRKEVNLEESRQILDGLLQIKMGKRFYLNCIFELALIDIAEDKPTPQFRLWKR